MDVFGGPDKAYVSFFPIQKAIAVLPSGTSFGGGPDRVEPETSRLIEAGTLLTGIIHVFSLSIGYRLILLPLVSGASYYLCPFIVCRRNVPQ